jgi:cell division transport system ATP-binding protein
LNDQREIIVQLIGAAMAYGSGPDVLRDIDLTLQAGSFHVLTGRSGAGKTSLLKMIALARPLARGRLDLFGQDVTHVRRHARPGLRRRIGMIFQDFRLLDHLTVFDNVALPLRLAQVDTKETEMSTGEMLSWLGMDNLAREFPPVLSMGQRQLIAAARAVVTRPALLLADEPTSHLDHDRGDRLMRLFMELNRMGTAVLIATHHAGALRRYPFRQLQVHDGTLWPAGPAAWQPAERIA